MSDLRIENSSIEYVKVLVVTDTDPTANTVKMAIVPAKTDPTGFQTAAWVGTSTLVQGKYQTYARILVGTGSAIGALTEGIYDTYVEIVATPEDIILQANGTVTIY